MYATAHRIQRNEVEGLNTFLYSHSGMPWVGWPPFLPHQNPGVLVHQQLEVQPPGGNLVRSYLDILTPDTTDPNAIQSAFIALLSRLGSTARFPQGALVGHVWFRFDCAQDLATSPRDEIQVLYNALDEVLLAHWPAT